MPVWIGKLTLCLGPICLGEEGFVQRTPLELRKWPLVNVAICELAEAEINIARGIVAIFYQLP